MSIILSGGNVKYDLLKNDWKAKSDSPVFCDLSRWLKKYNLHKIEFLQTKRLKEFIFENEWDYTIVFSPHIKRKYLDLLKSKDKKVITGQDTYLKEKNYDVVRIPNLHLKGVFLETGSRRYFIGGSSNFTKYGFYKNIELNYLVKNRDADRILDAVINIINYDIFENNSLNESNFEFPSLDLLKKKIKEVKKLEIISPFIQEIPNKTDKIMTTDFSKNIVLKYCNQLKIKVENKLHAKITKICNTKKEYFIVGSSNWTFNANFGVNKELDLFLLDGQKAINVFEEEIEEKVSN